MRTFTHKENRWFLPLFAELTITNLAHFSVLSLLTLYLIKTLQLGIEGAAAVLLCTSVGLRFSRIALAPFIDRLPPRIVICTAILISMAGYTAMMFARDAWLSGFAMLLVGTGYGLNGMLVTTLASYTDSPRAFSVYALMNSGTNLAAALSPVLSGWLMYHVSAQAPFVFSIGALCISFTISLFIRSDAPRRYHGIPFLRASGRLLRDFAFWRVAFLVISGWVIYTQKFASLPLFLSDVIGNAELIGLVIALNALIVLLFSLPMAHLIQRYELPGSGVLLSSLLLYMMAYGILAMHPSMTALWPALLLWSFGEALLMPQLNTLIAETVSAEDRLTGFSLASVAIGIGEAVGNSAGVALFLFALNAEQPWLCYGILVLFCFIACCGALILPSKKGDSLAIV